MKKVLNYVFSLIFMIVSLGNNYWCTKVSAMDKDEDPKKISQGDSKKGKTEKRKKRLRLKKRKRKKKRPAMKKQEKKVKLRKRKKRKTMQIFMNVQLQTL